MEICEVREVWYRLNFMRGRVFNLVKDKSNSNMVKGLVFVLRRWDSF